MIDISWMTGGKQGSGIDSSANLFSKILIKNGYNVYGYREYFSNIKGRHSFFTIRISDKEIHSISRKVDLAVFADKESVFGEKNEHGEIIQDGHIKDIKEGGTLIVDKIVDVNQIKRNDIKVLQVDFDQIINNVAKRLNTKPSEVMISKNTAIVTISAYMFGIDLNIVKEIVRKEFEKKGESVINMNICTVEETENLIKNISPILKLDPIKKEKMLLLEGYQASAIGKAIGGCKLQIYYPITPASDESSFLESHPELGIRVIQPESELAVIGMVTGAAIAGVRASTSTSGPGLALMTETISYAGMTETPIVVVDHQRGGPATGLPTRTEQGDLQFVLHQGHGDFDRIVIAPGDVEETIEIVADAFNYAELFQLPVIVLGEKSISQVYKSVKEKYIEDFRSSYRIERGKLTDKAGYEGDFKRFEFTNDNISPRLILGRSDHVMWIAGDEHDPYGHPYEESNNRIKMMEKRNGKSELILKTLDRSKKFNLYGSPENAQLLIVSWGSPKGAILDALDDRMAFLQIKLIEPLDSEIGEIIKKAKKVVCIEENISGQLRQHIASRTGILIENQILKYNGRMMNKDEVKEALEKVLNGEKKVILNDY
ncbi:MAG: 2-oxoacid:acceptor oxidoreductase subunit alpha [Candidatus Rehaiarchaeum fermentans]|nr:2-oxoacid:acceptor oxidoreductase subunit alpha [Candidatus Rehaiarchaeum fermentans]MCW1297072.1 2-oxoacid:acceptor oxidoreductase subunit alpha [Candidatus Rehaiarchaeum fermentans]MCW1302442.1 2-oxoacid:acceptor oxidoreductase subunit alpha [Candidatus Rehaiarchaeum fermentans]